MAVKWICRFLSCFCLLAGAGCSGNAEVIKALATDPANYCATLQATQGSLLIGRANTPGSSVVVTPGNCTINVPAKP